MSSPMRTSITIEFAKDGTQPPIYLAGSFSHPAWYPQAMEYMLHDNVYRFHKQIEVEEGKEYQYKFRVGSGDWWILDEKAPTVRDDMGNQNNLLKVSLSNRLAAYGDVKDSTSWTDDQISAGLHNNTSSQTTVVFDPIDRSHRQGDIPTLLIEKSDSKLSYGDDFGKDATMAQKQAHAMRAEDAEPDRIVIKEENQASAIADDVANSADKMVSIPLISHAEAGRIGLRRMSQTPIEEVANTAAEVADSAAQLDGVSMSHIELPPPQPADGSSGSGTTTPQEERAPLFAHECLEPPDQLENSPVRRNTSQTRREQDLDPNDPSIEEFPKDQRQIMEQFRAMEARLKEDEDSFDGVPPSPVVGTDRNTSYSDLPTPSPNPVVRDQSPSLGAIPEERASRTEVPLLPSVSLAEKRNSSFSRRHSGESSANGRHSRSSRSRERDSNVEQDNGHTAGITSNSPERQTKGKAAEHSSPDVKIQAATPASSTRAESFQAAESATATGALEVSHSQNLKSRNRQSSPLAARPVTPNSVHSHHKIKSSKNYLKALFQTVFVDWLGGLIARLCGKRRRH